MIIHWTDKTEPTKVDSFDDAEKAVTERFPKSKPGNSHMFTPAVSRCVFSVDEEPVAELFWEKPSN